MKYTVIYEKGPTSWGAYVPDLPGVISVGDSRKDAERLIHEAIELHLDGLREEGLPIPKPSSFAAEIDLHVHAPHARPLPRKSKVPTRGGIPVLSRKPNARPVTSKIVKDLLELDN